MSNGRGVLPSTPSVEWPRHIKRGRRDRCWLGGQLLFFWGDFSCCIKPQMWKRDGGKTAEWAYGGMTQGPWKHLAHPDIFPPDGEIHVFPTPRTFLWYLARVNWRIALSYKSILHYHGVSDKVLCSRNPKYYSIPCGIFFWSHKEVCGLSDLLYSLLNILHITHTWYQRQKC